MSDLISRKKAIKGICREVSEQENNAIPGEDLDVGVIVGLKMAVRIIKDQLSAEKTGKWIEQDDEYNDTIYQCSVCGEEFVTIEGTPADNLWNYCPNCGARMVD